MMHFVILFIAFCVLAAVFPKAWSVIKFLIVAPLVGVAFGGTMWAITAMICSCLISWQAFGAFLVAGVVLSGFMFTRVD